MDCDLLTLPPDADPLLRRAAIYISTGDFANADIYCERVLDAAPENAMAYLLKTMAKCKVQNAAELAGVPRLSELTEFKLARQFADAELAAKLDELVREHQAADAVNAIREASAARQNELRRLLTLELPSELAALIRQRIEAEQALMRTPSPETAGREAEATAALKNRIAEEFGSMYRVYLLQLLEQMKKTVRNKADITNRRAAVLSGRIIAIQRLLEAPDADVPALKEEIRQSEAVLGSAKRFMNIRDLILWIVVGSFALLAILALIGMVLLQS